MKSPIDILIDAADMRCTLCNAPMRPGCDCWVKCPCGWSYERGTECNNPIHIKSRTRRRPTKKGRA